MFNFLHNFTPDPIAFQYGLISVHWYGLIIVLAIIAAITVGIFLAKKRGLKTDDLIDLAFWTIVAGIIGARLYDVLIIDWAYFFRHPMEILFLWTGGLAIHGAIIGGVIALIVWRQIKKQNIWSWLDIIAVILPLAQAIGRWGNYFNQELFGGPTAWPWGIPIAENLRPIIYQSSQYFHPAFLYESLLNLFLFVVLFVLYQMSLRGSASDRGNPAAIGRDPHASSANWRTSLRMTIKRGQLIGLYLVGYGLIRFFMEFIRIDETAMWLGVRAPQIVSLLAVIIGLIIILRKRKDA